MTIKDSGVDVRYHKNTFAQSKIGDTKIAHLSLKQIGRFLFTKARSYDKFKPNYSRISFEGRYRMEC